MTIYKIFIRFLTGSEHSWRMQACSTDIRGMQRSPSYSASGMNGSIKQTSIKFLREENIGKS